MIRFTFTEGTAGMGNNLYIDAINLFGGEILGVQNIKSDNRVYLAPNPAQDYTQLHYQLKQNSKVSLQLTDITGKLIFEAPERIYSAGDQSIRISLKELPSGMYFTHLTIEGVKITRKIWVP
jgi:outer membrane protease